MSVRCLGVEKCGKCLTACPKGAIATGKWIKHAATREKIQHIHVDRSVCDNCGECAAVCYPKALAICGTEYTVEELLQRLRKDEPFYEQSGGGVTVSGGEPLCQPEFVLQLLTRLKACGIHTAVDTTGFAPYEIIKQILPCTDLFLYDLKHIDSDQHRIVTGVPAWTSNAGLPASSLQGLWSE